MRVHVRHAYDDDDGDAFYGCYADRMLDDAAVVVAVVGVVMFVAFAVALCEFLSVCTVHVFIVANVLMLRDPHR